MSNAAALEGADAGPSGRPDGPGGEPAGTARSHRTAAGLAVAAGLVTLLALTACDQFDAGRIAQTCLASAMKAAEPLGNPKERAEMEKQLRHYCEVAAKER